MKKLSAVRLCVFIWLFCALLSGVICAQAGDVANRQALLAPARHAYYDLRAEGLDSFECGVTPDWDLLLREVRQQNPEAADAAIKTLLQLQFVTRLSADNSVKLTHNDLTGQSDEMMTALRQIYSGMEQMTYGFFDTWKLFMLSPPFPEVASEYQLERVGSRYRLSYKENNASVVTSMEKDFAITDMRVTTPEFDSTIRPNFTRTARGFVLNGYEADYQSQKPEETTHLKVHMEYQEVTGLQMPQKLSLAGTYGGSNFAIDLTFAGCKVTKK
ncbi:MAG TPA: hypothetical protein VKT33_12680 [Candidatus Angelobacter sp.]|nr:hypothetical protein [Candidatus Angelobacter sp.]